jgi:hypothetical protein
VLNLFKAEFPESHQIALASAIISSCRRSAAAVKARYRKDYPIRHVLGQDRYHDIQNGLLDLNLSGVACRSERHPEGSTFYTSLETNGLRLTSRKVDSRAEAAPPTLFREREQALQLSFNFAKLVCEIQIVFARDTIDTPQYVDVRFPDGHNGYHEEFIDLVEVLGKPVQEERIPDTQQPRVRPHYQTPEQNIYRNKIDGA